MGEPNKKNFRKVLTDGFNDAQLNAFIMDSFDEVYRNLGTTDKTTKINALFDYCSQNECFQKLYKELEEEAPQNQFEKYQPYFEEEIIVAADANINERTETEKIFDLIRLFDFSMREDFQDFIEKNQGGIIIVHGAADYGHAWSSKILLGELQQFYKKYFGKIVKLSGKQYTTTIQHFYKGLFRQRLHQKPKPNLQDIKALLEEDEKRVMICADLSKIEFLNLINTADFTQLSTHIAENHHFLFFFVAEEMEENDLNEIPPHWLFLPKLSAEPKEIKAWEKILRRSETGLHRQIDKTELCQFCDNPLEVLTQISKQLNTPLEVYDWA